MAGSISAIRDRRNLLRGTPSCADAQEGWEEGWPTEHRPGRYGKEEGNEEDQSLCHGPCIQCVPWAFAIGGRKGAFLANRAMFALLEKLQGVGAL